MWALAPLAGIGFTVALFIADLSFSAGPLLDAAKIGVLAASLLSGAIGAALLLRVGHGPQPPPAGQTPPERPNALLPDA